MSAINTHKRLSRVLIGLLLYGLPVMSVAKEPHPAPVPAEEKAVADVSQHQVGVPQVLEIPPVQEPPPSSVAPSSVNPSGSIPEHAVTTGSLPAGALPQDEPAPDATASQRSYLGMLYATAEDEGRSGVKVLDVIPGSPAAHAGFVGVRTPVPETRTEQAMKVAIVALAMSPAAVAVIPLALAHQMFLTCHSPGDVISAVGDQMVRNAQEFSQELRRYRPGDSVAFSLMRCGKPLQITAVMEEEPDDFSSGEVEQDRAHPERFPQGGRGSGPTFNVNFGR